MSKAQRVTGAAIAGLALGLIGVAVAAVPASADTKHRVTTGITATGGATVDLTANGVKVTTPTNESEVTWTKTLTTPVNLNNVTVLGYTTTKLDTAGPGVNDAALAAFLLKVQVGTINATLVFEPYYNLTAGSGNPARNDLHTWNVLTGKFWSNELHIAAHGGAYADNKTLAEIKTMNPGVNIMVTGFGWRQGDTNAGTISLVNNVKLNTDVNTWDVPVVVVPTTTTAPKPSSSASTPVVAQPTLPITGNNVPVIVGTAVLLTAVGGTLLYGARRRKATN